MFKKLQINTLVDISFIIVIILFVTLLIVSHFQLSKIGSDADRITALRAPTVKASASMNIALNASLAAIRGWMLIEDENFLLSRQDSWQSIRKNEAILRKLSQNWTNPLNVERLDKISDLLKQLEKEQLAIELLTHTKENVPSSQVLFDSAAPLAATLVHNITTLIDYSKTQQSSAERLAILAAIADFRGSFALSLADIRAFLLSAEPKFKDSFSLHWAMNEKSYERLTVLATHMTTFENELLQEIGILKERFGQLPDTMFAFREDDEWNRANYLLKTTASKTSQEIASTLKAMVANQNTLLEKDSQMLRDETVKVETFQLVFLSVSLLITFLFSTIINKKYRHFRKRLANKDSLLDQNVMIATLGKDGDITSISNALCRKLGGVKEDFVGVRSNFFISSDSDQELHDEIRRALLTGQVWQGEFRSRGLEDEEIWFLSTIIPSNEEKEDGYNNILVDITDRKRIEEVSVTDKLTSLYNRRKFDSVIDHEIKLAKRWKKSLTLAIIDIDFFKKYNDHYGHPEGDAALTQVAAAIKASVSRPDDYVFRLGGEEFGVVFNNLDEKQSVDLLECIRKNVEELKIEHSQNAVSSYVTISIGAKLYAGGELIQKEIFYKEADKMLYTAKQTRNTVAMGL